MRGVLVGASIMLCVVWAITADSASAQNLDEHGCWIVPDHCTPISTGIDDSGMNYSVFVRNSCSENVEATVCLDMKNGSHNCGSFDVSPGEQRSYGISKSLASGSSRYYITGSANPSFDLVCRNQQYPGGTR